MPKTAPFSFGGEIALYQWEAAVQEKPKEGRFYTGRERVLPLWIFP